VFFYETPYQEARGQSRYSSSRLPYVDSSLTTSLLLAVKVHVLSVKHGHLWKPQHTVRAL